MLTLARKGYFILVIHLSLLNNILALVHDAHLTSQGSLVLPPRENRGISQNKAICSVFKQGR